MAVDVSYQIGAVKRELTRVEKNGAPMDATEPAPAPATTPAPPDPDAQARPGAERPDAQTSGTADGQSIGKPSETP